MSIVMDGGHSDDPDVSVSVCELCGALVVASKADQPTGWHQRVDRAISDAKHHARKVVYGYADGAGCIDGLP